MECAAQGNRIAFPLILLRGEAEADPGCQFHFEVGCLGQIEAALSQVESDVVKPEGCVIIGCSGVFAGAQKEEESQACHVCGGHF